MPAADRIPGRRVYGGVLAIQAEIEGQQVRLLVDTGCALSSVTPETAAALGLHLASFTGRRAVFTAGGASMVVPTRRIPFLRVGTAELQDVEVALMDLPRGVNLDGLLGVNVLERFRATFDFRHAVLVLRPEPLR